MKEELYYCDPKKNKQCTKESCFLNSGPCYFTTDPRYKKDEFEGWIKCDDCLPENEKEVLVCVKIKNEYENRILITSAIHEDGTMLEEESEWVWYALDESYNSDGLMVVPKGWYEYRHFNPDDVYNSEIDGDVLAWMPLPKIPYKFFIDN